MKKLLLAIIFIGFSFSNYAQSTDAYFDLIFTVLKTERKSTVMQNMQLNDSEKDAFWKLYDEYEEKLSVVQNKQITAMKEYDANKDNLDENTAEEIWLSIMNARIETSKIEKKYYKKFKKILPLDKAIRFSQIEYKLKIMLSAELSSQIPLIETNN